VAAKVAIDRCRATRRRPRGQPPRETVKARKHDRKPCRRLPVGKEISDGQLLQVAAVRCQPPSQLQQGLGADGTVSTLQESRLQVFVDQVRCHPAAREGRVKGKQLRDRRASGSRPWLLPPLSEAGSPLSGVGKRNDHAA
jgi:hypothetical protein